jgi:hypothetical protein
VSPPPVVVPPVSPPTNGTPEPATFIIGLVGLGAAAGYRAVRRKSGDGNDDSTK